ncbi:MAG: aldo/keto reductase [Muribaculaceae bacterium]|nr:aldo/keto reductase [Muribaculaceae bacterium]
MENIRLNNGFLIPAIGYGTYNLPDNEEGLNAIISAIGLGYRLIDGASAYGNERMVGEGVRRCGIDRSRLTITSKVANPDRGYDSTLRAFEKTISDLGLDYLDLYLIHWPADKMVYPDWERVNSDTWRALERLYNEGRVKGIGVSNFMPEHLRALLREAEIKPMINQIEFNPGMQQPECVAICRGKEIVVEAWSPLGRGRILGNTLLEEIARRYDKSVAQIALRWEIQRGAVPIPKSSNPERMRENMDIFDFSLSEREMSDIDGLAQFGNSGLSPENIDAHVAGKKEKR